MKKRKRDQKNHGNSKDYLSRTIAAFLKAKSDDFSLATRLNLKRTLARFVESWGDIPISKVTDVMLRGFVNDPARIVGVRRQRLLILNTFLRW